MEKNSKCRAEFERWATGRMDLTIEAKSFEKPPDDVYYKSDYTRARYYVWCAAWEAATSYHVRRRLSKKLGKKNAV